MSEMAIDVVRDDGELVGRLRPVADGWVPETMFGAALGPAADRDDAEALVLSQGLAVLAEPWWVDDTARGGVEDDGWRRCWLLEVRSDAVRVGFNDPKYLQAGESEWIDPLRLRRTPPG